MRFIRFLEKHVVAVLVAVLLFTTGLLVWFSVSGYSSNAQQASLGIAVAGILLAAISSVGSFMQAVETRKQREQQERPYVLAYFDGDSSGAIYFIIENAGNSPALGVHVSFDPAPVDFAGRSLNEVSLFQNAIGFLPPGKRHQQIIDVGHKLLADDMPMAFKVSVDYKTIYGDIENEIHQHDLSYLKQATAPRKSTEDYLKSVSNELRDLNRLVRRVVGTAAGGGSLLVETPDRYHHRVELLHRSLAQDTTQPRWKAILSSILRQVLKVLD